MPGVAPSIAKTTGVFNEFLLRPLVEWIWPEVLLVVLPQEGGRSYLALPSLTLRDSVV